MNMQKFILTSFAVFLTAFCVGQTNKSKKFTYFSPVIYIGMFDRTEYNSINSKIYNYSFYNNSVIYQDLNKSNFNYQVNKNLSIGIDYSNHINYIYSTLFLVSKAIILGNHYR